jgi:hypothetical protein
VVEKLEMLARSLLPLLLAALSCGCSFTFVQGPEVGPERCTRSRVLPLLDGAIAIGSFAGLAWQGMEINDHARGDGQIGTPIAIGTGFLVAGILYTVSAVGGNRDVAACRGKAYRSTGR